MAWTFLSVHPRIVAISELQESQCRHRLCPHHLLCDHYHILYTFLILVEEVDKLGTTVQGDGFMNCQTLTLSTTRLGRVHETGSGHLPIPLLNAWKEVAIGDATEGARCFFKGPDGPVGQTKRM